jgi:hypothetical protein
VLANAFGVSPAKSIGAIDDCAVNAHVVAPAYNYAPPPPRRVVYAPPPVVGVVVAPAYRYYEPRFGFYRAPRFYGRPAYRRDHHWN